MSQPVLEYQSTPTGALPSVWPLGVAALACLLPTVALELYLDLSTSLYIWWIPKFTLMAEGSTLMGLLLGLDLCRKRRWAWGITALLLHALAYLVMPQFTCAANG